MAMTRYLLDTNHAGTLLDESAPLWERLSKMDRGDCGLCRPSVGELWYVVFNSARKRANRGRLEALLVQFDVWEFDEKAAIEFGKLRAELRLAAGPIPIFDVLIASIARVNDLVLLTADHHFDSIRGLTVQNWVV
jgi:tRNA(fMet)-specific endonuclease VapC